MKESEWKRIYAYRIHKRLTDMGMTQRQLAEAIDLGEVQVSRYMNGGCVPKATTFVNIAKFLNCSVSDLIEVNEPIEIER